MSTNLIAVARAYARKGELGGGYRAIAYLKGNPASKRESDVLPSMDDARHFAKCAIADMLADVPAIKGYGPYNKDRWYCNYFSI